MRRWGDFPKALGNVVVMSGEMAVKSVSESESHTFCCADSGGSSIDLDASRSLDSDDIDFR
jgi:hypothetical protein